jgi:hypothetical protein
MLMVIGKWQQRLARRLRDDHSYSDDEDTKQSSRALPVG